MSRNTNNSKNNPTIKEITGYLKKYGWNYRIKKTDDGKEYVIAPMTLDCGDGILLTFEISGEFIMVSTIGLFREVPSRFASFFLQLNDEIKSVKTFCSMDEEIKEDGTIDVDLAFELWKESKNYETFAAFMDILYYGIEHSMKLVKERNIPHKTQFIKFED